jgi:hypothetical protein
LKYLVTFLLLLLIGCGESPKVSSDIKEAYFSSCRVATLGQYGSGILLDTGYILTAAHVIDANGDNVANEEERDVSVEFFSPVASIHSASIIFLGKWNDDDTHDIAVLKIDNPPRSKIRLLPLGSYDNLLFGESIYTIGCPVGMSPRVTDGRIDTNFSGRDEVSKKLGRCTAEIYGGNSGGGVFRDESLIGLATQGYGEYKTMNINMMVPIPLEGGGMTLMMGTGQATYIEIVSSWTEFVTAKQIVNLLDERGLKSVYQKHVDVYGIYFGILFNLFLLVVLYNVGKPFVSSLLRKTVR